MEEAFVPFMFLLHKSLQMHFPEYPYDGDKEGYYYGEDRLWHLFRVLVIPNPATPKGYEDSEINLVKFVT